MTGRKRTPLFKMIPMIPKEKAPFMKVTPSGARNERLLSKLTVELRDGGKMKNRQDYLRRCSEVRLPL